MQKLPIALWLVPCFLATGLQSAVNVPLTVQEAIYAGSIPGVNRTADPVTVGVPLPDDPNNGATDPSQLGLSGASIGQFRVLGRWPSGRIKWLLVDTQASLSAGQSNSSIALTAGSGNFGGAALAVDNGSSITVNTGAAVFTIRKANFNVVDQVVIGTRTVVGSGSSQGLVILGPTPGQTTCPCTTVYSSSNDAASTAIIEENGPAKTVIKASGTHVDASGNPYMHFTVRMYFYAGKTFVKVTSILQNADYGTSNSFATAFKAHQGYELRVKPNLSGSLNYTIANDTPNPTSGTLSNASDSAYIYQGESQAMQWKEWCSTGATPPCVPYTTDTGYRIVKNGAALVSGTDSQYPQGWADISDASGAGVEIGIYQMSAYWPKSLEFNGGGTDVRIGIWARENSQPYYTSWPKWDIHDLYLNFHASAPASLANEFLKFQHYLVGRAPMAAYNTAGVFEYPMADPAAEDAYMQSTASAASLSTNSACCRVDRGTNTTDGINADNVLHIYRYYVWRSSGGYNQAEQRLSDLENFIRRGQVGRYLNSAHFYRFQAETLGPHADGFTWRSKAGTTEVTGFGQPSATSLNCSPDGNGYCTKAMQLWRGDDVGEHYHWYGEVAAYYMSGDETLKDHIVSSMKDWFMNHYSYQGGWGLGNFGHLNVNGTAVTSLDTPFDGTYMAGGQIAIGNTPGDVYTIASIQDSTHLTLTASAGVQNSVPWAFDSGMYNSRSIAGVMFGATRLSRFLSDIGDPDAPDVLSQAERLWKEQVKGPLCASGYPSGCNLGTANGGPWFTQGISPVRGMHYGAPGSSGTSATCPSWVGRPVGMFHMSLLMQGLWELGQAKGPSWPDYWNTIDAAYGLSQFDLGSEGFEDHGQTGYVNQGFRYAIFLDRENQCNYNPGDVVNVGYASIANQTVWMPFFIQNFVTGSLDQRKFNIALQRDMAALGMTTSDFAGYQIGAVLNALQSTTNYSLQALPITNFATNGGGSYTISWTVPAQVQAGSAYRIKWGTKAIVDWIGFDAGANKFIGDPTTTMNWFAANNAVGTPAVGAPGSTQSFTISTGTPGLTAANFSVKAFVLNSGTAPATNLTLVSGNGQSGTVGQALPNSLIVKVTNSAGNPASGVAVTFAVSAGGGSLTATNVATDGSGLASSSLTLGPNVGANTVVASATGLSGSPIAFTETGVSAGGPGPAASLTVAAGNGQSGTVGVQLSSPFTVKVTDANRVAVPGILVTFNVTAGGGTLTATSASTDASGQASTYLTPGSAGTNTVTASSGALSGSPATFSANAVAGGGSTGTGVTWTEQPQTAGWPGYGGYYTILFDPVSQQTFMYGVRNGSGSIYSTDVFFYNSQTNLWTLLPGTGSMTDSCVPDTPTWPGNRHPIGQMAMDTKRNVLWLFGGVCEGTYLHDLYHLHLNANPQSDTWTQLPTPAHAPPYYAASMIYDPDDDVLFLYGYDGGPATLNNWVYCRTQENPTPGVLTAQQSTAGCAQPDDWSVVNVVGGIQPAGMAFPGMAYDPVTKKVIMYGGNSASGLISYNETWAYDIPTHQWTKKALSTTPPPPALGLITAMPALAYNTRTHRILFHQASNAGAPADWEYNPVADTWTKIGNTGGGAATDVIMSYDPVKNVLVSFSRTPVFTADIWQGSLSTGQPVPPSNPCDLDNSGTVDWTDVQIAINQALGVASCTADLVGTGGCNVIDVQRVINAANGGSCRTGQ